MGIIRKLTRPFRGEAVLQNPTPKTTENEEPEKIHVRGRQVISYEEAQARALERIKQEPGKKVSWGGIIIPDKTNFLFVGQSRSGKTQLIRQLMSDVFSRFGKGSNERAVIYDASTELISFLYGLIGDRIPIYILNPLDGRCTPWNMAADIPDAEVALNLGMILFPKGERGNPKDAFFSEAPATLFSGLANTFILTNEERVKRGEEKIEWTLRDICVSLIDEEDGKELLKKRWDTKPALSYLDNANYDVKRGIVNKITQLSSVAARWHHSQRKSVSLKEFVESKDSAILVLGGSSSNVVVGAVNRVIFEKLGALLLDQSVESETDSRTWMFMDEFADLGKMEIIGKMLSMGLKKGIRVVAAYQNIAGVEKVYGEFDPQIIKSEITTLTFLKQQGATADETSAFIGEREIKRKKVSRNTNRSIVGNPSLSDGETVEWAPEKEPVVPAAELNLPDAGTINGVSAYFMSLIIGDLYKRQFQWSELSHLANLRSEHPNHIPNDSKEAKTLKPWTVEERKLWGLSVPDETQQTTEEKEAAPNTSEQRAKASDEATQAKTDGVTPKEKGKGRPDPDRILDALGSKFRFTDKK